MFPVVLVPTCGFPRDQNPSRSRVCSEKTTNLPWQVAKSGPNPEGGFLVELIRVQGKERSAGIGDFLPQIPQMG
jgi:hypothetical protein